MHGSIPGPPSYAATVLLVFGPKIITVRTIVAIAIVMREHADVSSDVSRKQFRLTMALAFFCGVLTFDRLLLLCVRTAVRSKVGFIDNLQLDRSIPFVNADLRGASEFNLFALSPLLEKTNVFFRCVVTCGLELLGLLRP
jgi:hypothetical protein